MPAKVDDGVAGSTLPARHATIGRMGQLLLIVVVAVTVAAVVFGVTVLVSGRDPGLSPAEPDGRALPLPTTRPLRESDLGDVRFDLTMRGYRMAQVDQALRRAAYDIGYKDELIGVLEAEVNALREGRLLDADALRRAREAAQAPAPAAAPAEAPTKPGWTEFTQPAESEPVDDQAQPADDGTAEPVASAPADEQATAEAAVAAEPSPAADDLAEPADETAEPDEARVEAEATVTSTPAAEQPVEEPAAPAEPTTAAAVPAKPRTPARRTATRTSRPAKRTAAEADDSGAALPEDAPITKSAIGSETSATAKPAEDAESARR
ncbi:hypothetical protein GCM10009687_64970 [Asanoa iriomotensis]|uniref:DivIVA domain-containing protein n=1 Tax=Asanoa iriomotensis TaxID=234613 RepID=A0ABQ4C482_9ACTN|nr:hypothetical protein Air01nite_33310 [Asanoa iriomotensis]